MGARNSNSAKKQSLAADDPTCNMDNNCNNSNKGENESPIGGGSGYQRAIWPALGKKIGNDLNDPRSLEEQLKQPIQEIINKQIVDTARESDDMVKEYAKNLIIETLNDKESGGKLGIVLQNVFSYEPVLKTTRGLAHWAVQSDPSFSTALYNSKWSIDHWADTYGVKVISRYSVDYLDSMYAQHIVIKPILLWVLKQEDFFIQPMAVNVVHSIPWGKVCLLFCTSTNAAY